MSRRALLVSTSNPYPVVRDGCQRLVRDYVDAMFTDHDVYFLHVTREAWAPIGLFHNSHRVAAALELDELLAHDFEFVVYIGYKVTDFTCRLSDRRPSFCYTDTFPHPNVPAGVFRGIFSHRGSDDDGRERILLVGGSYDEEVFHPRRADEDLVLSVGRIHPDKAQLELVSRYRETIFERYGLPLYLAGGAADIDYYREVERYIDGDAVLSSIVDRRDPRGDANWLSSSELAALCNRARLFVSASAREAFGLSMIEALACGTTCVVNGAYVGFEEPDLRPRVHGNISAKRGCVLDLAGEALRDDVRIDASAWARTYSLGAIRDTVSQFVHAHV